MKVKSFSSFYDQSLHTCHKIILFIPTGTNIMFNNNINGVVSDSVVIEIYKIS